MGNFAAGINTEILKSPTRRRNVYISREDKSSMLTKEEIIKEVEQHKEKIRSLGVTKLTLFGSYARGEAKKTSDIDFLVEFKKGRGLFDDYVGLLHLLEDLFKKKIDLGEPHLLRSAFKDSILGGMKIEAKI